MEFLSRDTPFSKILGQKSILNFEETQRSWSTEDRTRGNMARDEVEREDWAYF